MTEKPARPPASAEKPGSATVGSGTPASRQPNQVKGPRGLIEQAARDIRQGLLDTDLHGTPTNIPGPHRAADQSGGAEVPANGVKKVANVPTGKKPRSTE
ncbi:MAG: hypothetical protein ACM3X0_03320 [Bacteroidota bacterium]